MLKNLYTHTQLIKLKISFDCAPQAITPHCIKHKYHFIKYTWQFIRYRLLFVGGAPLLASKLPKFFVIQDVGNTP